MGIEDSDALSHDFGDVHAVSPAMAVTKNTNLVIREYLETESEWENSWSASFVVRCVNVI